MKINYFVIDDQIENIYLLGTTPKCEGVSCDLSTRCWLISVRLL